MTEDVKRDLRLLRLRGTFDPKRHYKSFDHKKFPRHFQIGTVVESAADFHSGQMRDLKGVYWAAAVPGNIRGALPLEGCPAATDQCSLLLLAPC